jgi:hypothetical protein
MPERHIGELEVQLHSFLTSAIDGVSDLHSHTGTFSPGARAFGIYWTAGQGGPQSWYGCSGQETYISPLPETEPQLPRRRGHSLVTISIGTSNKMFPTLHVNAKNAFSCSLLSLKVREAEVTGVECELPVGQAETRRGVEVRCWCLQHCLDLNSRQISTSLAK